MNILVFLFLIFSSLLFSDSKTINQSQLNYEKLIELTDYLSNQKVYSVLASQNGQVFFEYYAPTLKKEEAHYLMSVTKSVLAICTAAAIEDKKISSWKMTLGEIFPDEAFQNEDTKKKVKSLTLEQIFMMSGIFFPHISNPDSEPEDIKSRWYEFMQSNARFVEVLKEDTVKVPGKTFSYNDHNAALAGAILQYMVSENAESYCEKRIFIPMGFKNYEWMHADPSGYVMGGYGLRLRPVDLLKLGEMILNKGVWKGKKILSEQSLNAILERKISSSGDWKNYSLFFWHSYSEKGGEIIQANGWKGQRLYIFPKLGISISVTSWLETDEDSVTKTITEDYLLKSLEPGNFSKTKKDLEKSYISHSKKQPFWDPTDTSERMVPTVERKERKIKNVVK